MTKRGVRPPPTTGMHHVAFNVSNFEATKAFYTEVLGLTVEWEPDDDNVYLTSGSDNIAPVSYTHLTLPTILLV